MKTCPFCKAEIEDNARFCLYCMKPLIEKEVILPPQEKKPLWLLPTAGTLLIALLLILLLAPGRNPNTPPESTGGETGTSGQSIQTDETAQQTGSTGDMLQSEPTPGNGSSGAGNTNQSPTQSPDTDPQKPSDNSDPAQSEETKQTTPTTAPTTAPTTTPTTAPTQTQPTSSPTEATEPPAIDYGNGIPGTTGYRTQFSIAFWRPEDDEGMAFNPAGTDVFCYRTATAAQMEAAGYSAEQKGWAVDSPGGYIRCGIYIVSDTINGAPVVCIGDIGLQDVVKFTVPKTISRLPSRAFYNCVEFKYLCLKGDQMTIPKDAFPPMDKRWYTIVIRSSANCKDENGRYWKDIAGEYGAVWEEWNG